MSRMTLQKNTARLMAVLLSLVWILSMAPAAVAAESGTCGDNLSWSYSNGILTISGSGDMTNYSESARVPWYSFREEILALELPAGLTSIGSRAFYGCIRLTSVDLPEQVRSIGEYAFAGCESVAMLDLGTSLQSIGTGAFYDCRKLVSLRFPATLTHIGEEAFYHCAGITAITVPASVTSIGAAAFAYCTSLIRAELNCAVTTIPDWLFFGCKELSTVIISSTVSDMGNSSFKECDNLYYVSYDGDDVVKDKLEQTIAQNVPGFGITGSVTPNLPNDTSTTTKEVEKNDGSIGVQDVTVTQKENSTVSSTVEYTNQGDKTTVSSDVTITVENQDGWDDVADAIDEAIRNHNNALYTPGTESGTIDVTVYVKDTQTIETDILDGIQGKDITVTFIDQNGSVWKVNGKNLTGENTNLKYDLRYMVTPGSDDLCRELGTQTCYYLAFLESGQINAEVLIRLSDSLAMQKATLLQRTGKEWTYVQSSVIDRDGYAHFYLASVDRDTEYCIALNLPAAAEEPAPILPEEVKSSYGNVVNYEPIQYEITGRTSSWNMGLGKVMGILAAVMVGVIVLVGTIMFIWNKKRLEAGYVPNWDDEDDYK